MVTMDDLSKAIILLVRAASLMVYGWNAGRYITM